MSGTVKLSDVSEDYLWDLEDSFTNNSKEGSGGKGKRRGKETIEAIYKQNRQDAEIKRKEEAVFNIKKELEHFPVGSLSEEMKEELVHDYSEWVIKSLNQNYPYFNDLDKDINYSQSRSSGPGGQNVNKTSTAVTAVHSLTGIYARSEDSREMLVNKKESMSKIFERLEKHIGNWRNYLRGELSDKESLIEDFVKDLIKEKS